MGRWWPARKRAQPSGALTRWRRRPKRPASPSNAVRSAASCGAKGSDGDKPIVGLLLATKTLSQKDGGRHPLHGATSGVDDRLYRRTRTSSAAHLSPRPRLVTHWTPHQIATLL